MGGGRWRPRRSGWRGSRAAAWPCSGRGGLPGGLAPLVGTYAAWNPWTPELRVRPDAAGTGLALDWRTGDEDPLTAPPGDAGFRPGDDPASPERARFTTLVEGRPMQLVVSGW
ncbi:MAG TPA: hypothetical protein VOA19_06945, partial [Actinomycetes bacterium]|nr:hypothetical protein [Actinomycetes bacterium]